MRAPADDRQVAATARAYRRLWLPEAMVLVGVALLATPVFWLSDLDIAVARLFYHPHSPEDPWLEGQAALWQFFYHSAPVLAGLMTIGSLAFLAVANARPALGRYRTHAWLVLLVVLLGPGLLVNGVLKEHWDRPRPRQVEQLGGNAEYVPPLRVGTADSGKSFPAGHSSVAFSLVVFWFIWRRRSLALASAALVTTLVLGTLYGVGRMAAGGHFLSDVLWSALVPAAVALILYHFVLRIPAREDAEDVAPQRRVALAGTLGYGALAVAIVTALFLFTPFRHSWSYRLEHPVQRFALDADAGAVTLRLSREARAAVALRGKALGFGFPGNRLLANDGGTDNEVTYSIEHKGVFTEIETRIQLHVDPAQVRELHIDVARGDVHILDSGLRDALALTVSAPHGVVVYPE